MTLNRGTNVGRTVFGVAAAAGVAGLLNYTPPPTELRAAAPAAERPLPVVAGPFTATPASIPLLVEATAPATTTPPAPATTVAPPTTQAPPPTSEPAPPPPETEPAPYEAPVAWYPPARVYYYPPEPEPVEEEAAPADDSGDKCTHFDNLLSVLDDSDLRAAVATVGC